MSCKYIHISCCAVSVKDCATGNEKHYSNVLSVSAQHVTVSDGVSSDTYYAEGVTNIQDMSIAFANYMTDCEGWECPTSQPATTYESLLNYTITLQDGESTDLATWQNHSGGVGIAGFDFDLKPINGDGRAGFVASSSQATSSGSHGDRDLDGGGSFQIKPERLPDTTFNRLVLDQTFTTDTGSVAVLMLKIIMP